jgi:hypothetical protein
MGHKGIGAPDAGDSVAIPSLFLRLSIFSVGRLRRPRPSADNTYRWALGSPSEANIVTAICGFVGSVERHLPEHTYMCHLVRRFSGGFEMRSRFWIGRDIRLNSFTGSAIAEKLVNTKIAEC